MVTELTFKTDGTCTVQPGKAEVFLPGYAGPGVPVWCMNAKHGMPATQVCTERHDKGVRWQARWVADGQERAVSYARKVDAEAKVRQITAEVRLGSYVGSAGASTAFGTVAEEWHTAKRAKLSRPRSAATGHCWTGSRG